MTPSVTAKRIWMSFSPKKASISSSSVRALARLGVAVLVGQHGQIDGVAAQRLLADEAADPLAELLLREDAGTPDFGPLALDRVDPPGNLSALMAARPRLVHRHQRQRQVAPGERAHVDDPAVLGLLALDREQRPPGADRLGGGFLDLVAA